MGALMAKERPNQARAEIAKDMSLAEDESGDNGKGKAQTQLPKYKDVVESWKCR